MRRSCSRTMLKLESNGLGLLVSRRASKRHSLKQRRNGDTQ
uniref:Uncharacterized protein n=1 Tax=Ulva partita TaxID=1605170 RepID=A0A1C9ZW80_9CHLO|nr:hypothetical protein [Ulva partita]